ncbi:MAG: ArnT family glycosyltransferase [Candidatus Njordarchaeales archaeon]
MSWSWLKMRIKIRSLMIIAISATIILALATRVTSLNEPGFTCDEITYVEAGIKYLKYFDFEYNVEHPPLAKYLIGLSVLALGTTEFSARLPIAILGTLTCLIVFFLAKELYDQYTALLSSILIALSTYHIAHSRVATLDVPLTFFYVLTILLFWKGLKNRWYLLFSGIALGLAIATKYTGIYLYFIIGVYLIIYENLIKYRHSILSINLSKELLVAAFLSIGTFIVVAPFLLSSSISVTYLDLEVPLITKSVYRNFHHLQTGHANYFIGEVTNAPPPWFYLVYLTFRLPIPMIIFFGLGLAYALYKRSRQEVLLLLWILIPLGIFSFQKVKLLHYLVPIIPPLCILAARSMVVIISVLRNRTKKLIGLTIVLALIIWQALIVYSTHPYYLLYFNEFAGGPVGATRYFTIGWGEGLREAAHYVETYISSNEKVASFYNHLVSFYCQCEVLPFPKSLQEIEENNVKYVIVYLNQLQRYSNKPVIRYLSQLQPEKIIYIREVPLVWIYRISQNSSHISS